MSRPLVNRPLVPGLLFTMVPAFAQASDFTSVAVSLACFVIAIIVAALGFYATAASKQSGRTAAMPSLVGVVLLTLLGVGMVLGEARHMADSDFIGTLVVLLVPCFLSILVPLVVSPREP